MERQQLSVTPWSAAKPDVVHRLLRSGANWPAWSPIESFELERPGRNGNEGIGAVRLFRTGPVRSRGEIVTLEADRRFGYTLRHEMPLRDYRADVELDGGTLVRRSSSFAPAIFGTSWFYRLFLSRFIQRCADGLAAFAATTGASPPVNA